MTPALLDVNVLLALAWPNHQHHQAAHAWFHAESRHGWTTCALTQVAFVRLSSNPAYTPEAVPPRDGAALLARFTAHKHHRFWRELPALATTMLLRVSGHQQVMDAIWSRSRAITRGESSRWTGASPPTPRTRAT